MRTDQSEYQSNQTGFRVRKIKRSVKNTFPTRKRERKPDEWIDNKAKVARNSGIAGMGRKGKPIVARSMKESCGASCKKKCQSRMSLDDRQKAFEKFWSLENKQAKWNCIIDWVQSKQVQHGSPDWANTSKRLKQRDNIYIYSLPLEKKMEVVCQTMFLNTLGW